MGSRRLPRALGTLLLLLACVALYLLLVRARGTSSVEPGDRAPAAEAAPPFRSADGDRAALEAGPARRAAPEATTRPEKRAPAPATGPGDAATDEPQLRVRLETPPGFTAWPLQLLVEGRREPVGDPPPYAWYTAHRRVVDLPIQDIVRVEGVSYLTVGLRHKDLLDVNEIVPVEDVRRGVTLHLRAAHVVTARLLGPGREPVGGHASLHRTGPEAAMHDDRRRWAALDAARDSADFEGGVRLRVAEAGRYLLVVEGDDVEPWGRLVDVPETGALDLGEIAIRRSARLTGRLTVAGRPLRGARVIAKPLAEGWAFYAATRVVRWDGQRVTAHQAEDTTSSKGRFEIAGLSPGPYELDVVPGSAGMTPRPSSRVGQAGLTVVAPDDDVEVALTGFVLDVEVRAGGRPAEAAVSLTGVPDDGAVDHADGITSADGLVSFLLLPGVTYRARARRDGHAEGVAERQTGEVGGRGRLTLELGAALPRGDVRIHLEDEQGGPIETAAVHLVAGATRIEWEGGSRSGGVHEVRGVDVGAWDMTVFPGATSDHDPTGYFLPLRARVEVVAGEAAEVRLKARRGGRLLLGVRDEAGRHAAAGVVVRDEHGKTVALRYRIEMDSGDVHLGVDAPDGRGPALALEVLEPGAYEVRVEAGGKEPVTRSVTIEAGRTARLDVTVR
jgi:hypothetical protein